MSQNVEQSGADNLKLIIAGFIGVGACLTVVGIIPVIILLIGALLAYRGGDVSNVRSTTRFVQIAIGLGALIVWCAALYFLSENSRIAAEGGFIYYSDKELPSVLAALGVVGFVVIWLLNAIWYKPIESLLQRKSADSSMPASRTGDGPSIMAREALAPYSTADELLKWKRLRDEGLVTDEEFSEARTKIMSGR